MTIDISNYEGKLKRELEKIDNLPDDDPDKNELILFADAITDDMEPSSSFNRLGRIRRLKSVLDHPLEDLTEDKLRLAMKRLAKKNMGAGEEYASSTKRKYLQTFADYGDKRDVEALQDIEVPSVELNKIDLEDVLTKGEVQELIQAAENSRDRAIISTCWEGAWRVTALLSLRVKDWKTPNDQHGLLIAPSAVGSKDADGEKVPITFTRGYLENWLSDHPTKEPEDALFCRIDREDHYGDHLSPEAARKRLQKAKANTDIEKPVHVHAFRYARATYMKKADRYDDMHIEQVLGWAEGSQQHKRYEHVTQDEKVNSILRAQGYEVKDDDLEPEDKDCPRCGQLIPYDARNCPYCAVRVDDRVADWYIWYRKITPDDDAIRQQYDDIPSATPSYAQLQKGVYEHVSERFALASAGLNDDQIKNLTNTVEWISQDHPIWSLDEEQQLELYSDFVVPARHDAENIAANPVEYEIEDNRQGWTESQRQNLIDNFDGE